MTWLITFFEWFIYFGTVMIATNTIDPADQIIARLEATKKEIERFLHELTYDNASAELHYQQLKQAFKSSIDEMRTLLEQRSMQAGQDTAALLLVLSQLEERLETPSPHASADIKKLIKGVKSGLNYLVSALVTDSSYDEVSDKIHDWLQQYRLKFEILKLKLALGTLHVKYVGKDTQHSLNLKIQALEKFVRTSKHNADEKLRKARYMGSKIYSAFRKIYS